MSQMTPTEEKAVVREVAQNYVRIEQNTEYLTNLVQYSWKQRITYYSPNMQVDITSFFRVISQLSYLMYTCFVKKKTLFIGGRLLVMHRKSRPSQVYLPYVMESELTAMHPNDQRLNIIAENFVECSLCKAPNAYGLVLLPELKKILELASNEIKERKPSSSTGSQSANQYWQTMNKQCNGLVQFLDRLLIPHAGSISKPRCVIQSLEETELFRQHSSILKIINNSVYFGIMNSPRSQQMLRQAKMRELDAIRKLVNPSSYDREIQHLIDQYMMCLVECKILTNNNTVSDSVLERQFNIANVEAGRGEDRKFVLNIRVNEKILREMNQQTFSQILENCQNCQPLSMISEEEAGEKLGTCSRNQYEVEYISGKNLICVKYITEIELSIENTDTIMYQCNNMPFDISSVSLELLDRPLTKMSKGGTQKRREKVLAFKAISHFNTKEEPLTKILLLIDLVMISAKILEPELKKPSIKIQDYWRIEEQAKKVNHVTNLFMRKASKTYSEIQNEL